MSHLRQRLPGVVESRPYRLTLETVVDAAEVLRLLQGGRVADAAARYRGDLLPESEAPLLVEYRHRVCAALGGAVLEARAPVANLLPTL